jgi:hypothetical protein
MDEVFDETALPIRSRKAEALAEQLKDMMMPGHCPAKPTSRPAGWNTVCPSGTGWFVVGYKAGLRVNIAHSLQQRQPHLLGLVYSLPGLTRRGGETMNR